MNTDRLYDALDLYNRGDYMGAQEQLEDLYNSSDAAEQQPFVRALIALACGMHLHFRRGGGRGAVNLLRQALFLLQDLRPTHLGIETGELYEALEAYVDDLQQRKKSGASFLDRWLVPHVRFSRHQSSREI